MRIEAADRFSAWAPLNTWSVIVTILGDLLRAPADTLSGQVLSSLVEPMGITNQALRVALHRLRKDGWVESTKDGRKSLYRLTAMGREARDTAARRIYAPQPPIVDTAVLIIAPPDHTGTVADTLGDTAVHLAPRIALTAPPLPPLQDGFLVSELTSQSLPDWVVTALASDALRRDFARLTLLIDQALSAARMDDLRHRTITRLLILHHWRRLQLRTLPLADALLPDDWEGARARRAVMRALTILDAPTLAELTALPTS